MEDRKEKKHEKISKLKRNFIIAFCLLIAFGILLRYALPLGDLEKNVKYLSSFIILIGFLFIILALIIE